MKLIIIHAGIKVKPQQYKGSLANKNAHNMQLLTFKEILFMLNKKVCEAHVGYNSLWQNMSIITFVSNPVAGSAG